MHQQPQWDGQMPAQTQAPTAHTQQQVQPLQQQPFMQQPFQQQPFMQQQPPFFYAPQFPPGMAPTTMPQIPGMLPLEMSYIENILRLNRGKRARVYMTFENNPEWNARIFTGIVEEAGRDHIVLSDPEAGRYYLLLMVNLDYVEFEEPIEYEYPFATPAPLAAYSPR